MSIANRGAFFTAACLATTVFTHPAFGQMERGANVASSDGSDIIVTARRREESLQKVPVAIAAFSAADLESKQIKDTRDLQTAVAGINLGGAPTQARETINPAIRGQNPPYGGRVSVETYLDEALISGSRIQLYDMSSVQVLKGPQGVAFGRQSNGGALLFYSQKPTDRFEGHVKGEALLSRPGYMVEGAINVPMVPDLLMLRVAGQLRHDRGFTENLTARLRPSLGLDRWNDGIHQRSWRVSLLFTPTDWLENRFTYIGESHNNGSTSNVPFEVNPNSAVGRYPGIFDELAAQKARGPRKVMQGPYFGNLNHGKSFQLINTTVAELSGTMRIKNIISFRKGEDEQSFDLDGFQEPFLDTNVAFCKGDKVPGVTRHGCWLPTFWSEEAQLQGDRLFDSDIQYILGYFHSSSRTRQRGDQLIGLPLAFSPTGFASLVRYTGLNGKRSNVNDAVFAQLTAPLTFITPDLSLTAGIRHSWDKDVVPAGEQLLTFYALGADMTIGPKLFGQSTPLVGTSTRTKGVNYNVTLDWKVTPDFMIYAAHRRGFKGGSQVSPNNPAIPVQFRGQVARPEVVRDVELGMKWRGDLGSVGLRTNLSLYKMWTKDLQRALSFDGATSFIINAGDTISQGIELDQSIRFGEFFELSGNYSYLDAHFQRVALVAQPYIGRQVSFAIKHQGSITGTGHIPLDAANGKLSVSLTYYAQSGFITSDTYLTAGPNGAHVKSYDLFSANILWSNALGLPIDFSVYGKNLANKTNQIAGTSLWSTTGFNSAFYGEPRTVGASITYRFGGN